jgi:tetratricopeptide (TPR) repeat protein
MNLNRLYTSLLLTVVSMVCVNATEADDIRKELKHAQGKEKLELLSQLCDVSLEEDNYQSQWQCINDYIMECRNQGNKAEESFARWKRILLFYNSDQNDSVIHYAPDDITFIRDHGEREKFYDTWSCLVNTYVYGGSVATGLKEAEKMYQFAKEDKNDFGNGLACYVMGTAYYNMNNLDEAAEVYQRGIDVLMRLKPVPLVLSELFYSQCEVLEKQGRYEDMQRSTLRWHDFLEQFIHEMKLDRDNPGMLPNWAYYYLGCAQAALGLGNTEKAEEFLEEARNNITSEESAIYRSWLFYRIRYLMMLEFYPEALLQSDQLLPLYEEAGDMAELIRSKEQRAEILTHLGRHIEAAKLYKEMYHQRLHQYQRYQASAGRDEHKIQP